MKASWTAEDLYFISERAWSLAGQGRYREALVIFEGLSAIAPAERYAYNGLAACHVALGDFRGALGVLDVALKRWPDDAELRTRRCEALLNAGDVAGARAEFARLPGRRNAAVRRLEMRLEQVAGKSIPAPQL